MLEIRKNIINLMFSSDISKFETKFQIWEIFMKIHVRALPKCLCVTSCFVNSSLNFQGIPLFSSPKDTPDFQLHDHLSQNSLTWSSSQDLSLRVHLPRTGGLFCLCVIGQYFIHKMQIDERLRLKLSSIIEFVYLHIV